MSQMATADRLDTNLSEEEKLSDRDIKLIQRYLSDPTVFPKEFKRWITEHSSDTVDIAKTQVHGLVNNAGQVVIGSANMGILGATMAGVIVPYAAVAAPEGWLLCDGHEELRSDYAALFALLGTTWGIPSDASKFKIPDLRGRTPYGVDSNVGFAANDGRAAGTRGPKHHHYFIDTKGFSASGSGGTSWGGDHNHGYQDRHPNFQSIQGGTQGQFWAVATTESDMGRGTDGGGGHDHGFSVTVNGQVTIASDTSGGGDQDAGGWTGLNYIMGSGKVP